MSKGEQATANGFREKFLDEINQDETYEQTFDRINDEHEIKYGKERYASYNSFRVTNSKK